MCPRCLSILALFIAFSQAEMVVLNDTTSGAKSAVGISSADGSLMCEDTFDAVGIVCNPFVHR